MTNSLPVDVQLYNFVDDLERCLNFEYNESIQCDNIILCGMGGSAISGNVVADYCFKLSDKPITVIMNSSLPGWVNERTLAIVSSYSGNTLETIEAYSQLVEIGCKIVVLTSGGYLKSFAEKNGDSLILLPDNLHPRHSIGYMIGYTLGIIRSVCSIGHLEDLIETLELLKRYRANLVDKKNGIAYKLARKYVKKIPVICSYSEIQSIIFRWKTQFNENSKYIGFCSTISEFYFTNMNGWTNKDNDNFLLTLIVNDDHYLEDADTSKLVQTLNERKIKYELIILNGKTSTENMFRALMLGDYMSVYLAEIQDIEPSEVPPVNMMKKKLRHVLEERVNRLI